MTTVKWLEEKLNDNNDIQSIKVISDQLMEITHTNKSVLKIGVISIKKVNLKDVEAVVVNNDALDFIVNIPHDAYIDGSVFTYLEEVNIPIGGVGDLYRIISNGSAWDYVNPEVGFIIRGLNQHTRVERFERLNNKTYKIYRKGLEPVVIVAINDYEFSEESVRSGKAMFDDTKAILANNPNARISADAYALGSSLGISILKWGELLGNLNKWKL